MKTAKDLKIPFQWDERRPILLDHFFYIPKAYEHKKEAFHFFQNENPIVVEYCSGNGQWIGDRAKQNPHLNWIAVEKRFDRARKIWLKIYRENLPNLCVICGDGLDFTRYYAPKEISEAYVNFPDPWPKLRHAKHRLVREEFLQSLLGIMKINGKIICATDDLAYFSQMQEEFSKCPQWKEVFNGTDWPNYGESYFKDLWMQKGRIINYLSYEKRA